MRNAAVRVCREKAGESSCCLLAAMVEAWDFRWSEAADGAADSAWTNKVHSAAADADWTPLGGMSSVDIDGP